MHCEVCTPPVVCDDSCCDWRASRLIFRSFFIQQRRCFRCRRLTIYIKTDINEPVPTDMSWGLRWPSWYSSQLLSLCKPALVTTVWQGLQYDRENDSIVHETKVVSLCVGVFIFQALPRAPLFAKTKSVLTFFFFFFFTFRPNISLAFLQTWRISDVIPADGCKNSYTKRSNSCQMHLMQATV